MLSQSLLFKFLFVLLVTISIYSDSFELKVVFSSFILVLLFIDRKIEVHRSFFNILTPLICIVLIALVSSFFNGGEMIFRVKDFFYLIKPLLFLLVGYLIARKQENVTSFIKIIIYLGGAFASFHCFQFLLYIYEFGSFSVPNLRSALGKDNFFELIVLAIIIANKKYNFVSIKYMKTITIILSISFILYFSRTMFLLLFLVSLGFLGYVKVSMKGLKYMLIGILGIGLLYTYLFSIEIDRNSASPIDNFLYKMKMAPGEIFIAKKSFDIRNHAELWDHWRAYEVSKSVEKLSEGNVLNWTFGLGVGSLLDLGFYAPVSGDPKGMRYISIIHNGYGFVLYKAGILGVVFYLLFLFGNYINYRNIKRTSPIIGNLIWGITLFYFCSTLVICGIYNFADPLTLVLGGLSFYRNEI